jgi:Leucine Rich Repeat (LRR) protein
LNLAQPEIPGAGRFTFKDVLEIVRMQVTDLGIAQLRSLKRLRSLDLTGVNVTAQGIEALVGLPGLQNLVLAHAPHIDDSSVAAICRLRQLKALDLRGTRIGNGALRQLSGIRTLKKISLSGAGVTADAVAAFRQERPDCEVLRSE